MAAPKCKNAGRGIHTWAAGTVVFLHKWDEMEEENKKRLVESNYLPRGATGHPAIILHCPSERPGHILVTIISSYNNDNKGKTPWTQGRKAEDFRAIGGAERPSKRYPALSLGDGREMPKAHAGWVNVRNLWLVPVSVIGRFVTKHSTGSDDVLQLQPDALESLRNHFEARCPTWRDELARLCALEPPGASDSPTSLTRWRASGGPRESCASSTGRRHTAPRSAALSSASWRRENS